MYAITHDRFGKVSGVIRSMDDGTERSIPIGAHEWDEFLAANAHEPIPLAIADRPPPSEAELSAAKMAEAKAQLASSTAAAVAADAKLQVLLDAVNECRAAVRLEPLAWSAVPAAAEGKL